MKAVLLLRQGQYPRTHLLRQLLAECARYDSEFERFAADAEFAEFMENIYMGARYVDGSETPLAPPRRYSETDSEVASDYADGILTLAQAQFPAGRPDNEA